MIPIVGGSYMLDVRQADVQRTVNMFPVVNESGTPKQTKYLKQIPGLRLFGTMAGQIRALKNIDGTLYGVAGSKFVEITSAGTSVDRGTLASSTGRVSIAVGVTQVVIVDGPNGYISDRSTSAFTQISDPAFYGSATVQFIDNYFTFVRPGTQQYYWALADASSFDALNFASAEGSPDNIVEQIVDHRQLILLGSDSTEIYEIGSDPNLPFQRIGAAIETGCAAPGTACKIDNAIVWLGQDERGAGIIWRLNGYTPTRISTNWVEEKIRKAMRDAGEVSGAAAYSYQQDGHSFYCINVPGIDTTLAVDVATGVWHDRAELVNGVYAQHRATCHAFCYGKHLVGSADGRIYELDPTISNNAGDVLVRDRIVPDSGTAPGGLVRHGNVEIGCTVGEGLPNGQKAQIMMRRTNDGKPPTAANSWAYASLGNVGETEARVIFPRTGMARDRVWQFRVTDDAAFSLLWAK